MAKRRGYRAAAPSVRGLLGRLGPRGAVRSPGFGAAKAANRKGATGGGGGGGMNPLKGGSPRSAWMGDPARRKRRTQTQDPGGSKSKMKSRSSQ